MSVEPIRRAQQPLPVLPTAGDAAQPTVSRPAPQVTQTRDVFEPAARPRRSTDEILREYTVAPTEMTRWPTVAGIAVPGSREVTAGEARMLDDLGWLRASGVRDTATHAGEEALRRFPRTGNSNGHADAFRHAYANALLTQQRGEQWTAAFTTAHETNPDSSPLSVAMDLYNNEVGRRIARENPNATRTEMANLVQRAVENGEMMVIGPDLRLRYSDELPRNYRPPTNRELPMGPRNAGKEVEAPYTI